MLEKILSNRFLTLPFLVSCAAGAVVSIAAGFRITYEIVVFLGART